MLQLGQVVAVGAVQQVQGPAHEEGHPGKRHPAAECGRTALAGPQEATGQGHAQGFVKPFDQGVGLQAFGGRQGLEEHQEHRVEHGAAQHFQQQVEAAEIHQPGGVAGPGPLQGPEPQQAGQPAQGQRDEHPADAHPVEGHARQQQLEPQRRQVRDD